MSEPTLSPQSEEVVKKAMELVDEIARLQWSAGCSSGHFDHVSETRALAEANEERTALESFLRSALSQAEGGAQDTEAFVRDLLWSDHPECCGSPVVGAEYMGQQEMVCCGCPEPAPLNDAQIVASLRAKFPQKKGGEA